MTGRDIIFALTCITLCAGMYFVMPMHNPQKCNGPVAELFLHCIK